MREIIYKIDPNTPGNIVKSITDCPFGTVLKRRNNKIVRVGSLSCMLCPEFKKADPKKHTVLCNRSEEGKMDDEKTR